MHVLNSFEMILIIYINNLLYVFFLLIILTKIKYCIPTNKIIYLNLFNLIVSKYTDCNILNFIFIGKFQSLILLVFNKIIYQLNKSSIFDFQIRN